MPRISTSTTIHHVTVIKARSDNGVAGSLRLEFATDDWGDGYVEYVAFLDDQVLVERLAKAINEISAARKAELQAPFKEGDLVRIKNNDHLGLHRVCSCEWFDATAPGVPAYWLCHCDAVRDPIDWSSIPEGATGIVVGSNWQGCANRLESA